MKALLRFYVGPVKCIYVGHEFTGSEVATKGNPEQMGKEKSAWALEP